MTTKISGSHAARTSRSRPDYLRVVPEPGPVIPATPCPPWCALIDGGHDDPTDRFHWGHAAYIGASETGVNPDILEDGTRVVTVRTFGEGSQLNLAEVDELIAELARVRDMLIGTQVAA